jgi:hypothetical protein
LAGVLVLKRGGRAASQTIHMTSAEIFSRRCMTNILLILFGFCRTRYWRLQVNRQ